MTRLLLLVLGCLATGCINKEGDRCNQLEVSPTCDDGLQCVVPPNCPALVAYCCPTNRAPANPSCMSCPVDGGTD